MPISRVHPWRRMMSAVCLAGLAAVGSAALLAPTARAEKAPEPSPYPVAPELDFKLLSGPKRVVVSIPGEPHGQAFYYITYTVTNKGDKPYNFLPTFDMLTDDGRL